MARSPSLTPLTRIWQSVAVPTVVLGKFLHSTPVTFIPAVLALVAILAARNLPLVAGLKVTTSTDGVAVTVTVTTGAGVVEAHPASNSPPSKGHHRAGLVGSVHDASFTGRRCHGPPLCV